MHSKLTFTIYPQATSISSAIETPLSSPWSQIVTSEPESDWMAEAAEYYQRKLDKSMQEPSSPAPPKHSGIPERDPPPKCSRSPPSTIRATPAPVWPDFEPERDWEQVAAEYYQRKYQMGLMVSPKTEGTKEIGKEVDNILLQIFSGPPSSDYGPEIRLARIQSPIPKSRSRIRWDSNSRARVRVR